MPKNEQTSPKLAKIASQGLRAPSTLTTAQIRELAGSVLTQAPDHPKPAPKESK